MKKSEFDLRKELEERPFKRHGFTESLRRRIEARLDEENQEDGSWRWLPFAIGLCAAILMIWLVQPSAPEHTADSSVLTSSDTSPSLQAAWEDSNISSSVPLRSALLLAFRADTLDTSNEAPGRYRTLLIAPMENQLSVVAEGEDLLVPYGQTFWSMEHASIAPEEDKPPLVLRPIHANLDDTASNQFQGHSFHAQQARILFAGNRYVSVQLPAFDKDSEEQASYRVYNYTDLVQGAGNNPVPAVALSDILDEEHVPQSEQWYIERSAGNWRAVPVEQQLHMNNQPLKQEQLLKSWELSPDIVSHDGLSISWNDIQSRQIAATDALESPAGELIAILTDSHLYMYSIHEGKLGDAPLLSLPLQEGEMLIMSQWAIDRYVPLWIEKVSQALRNQ